jgi:hypothetical protein
MRTVLLYLLVLGGVAYYLWSLRAEMIDEGKRAEKKKRDASEPREGSSASR